MTDWRPIEEAPRDGRSVLLWARLKSNPPERNDFHPIVGFWHHSIKEWKVWPDHLAAGEVLLPSHWIALPPSPNER